MNGAGLPTPGQTTYQQKWTVNQNRGVKRRQYSGEEEEPQSSSKSGDNLIPLSDENEPMAYFNGTIRLRDLKANQKNTSRTAHAFEFHQNKSAQ